MSGPASRKVGSNNAFARRRTVLFSAAVALIAAVSPAAAVPTAPPPVTALTDTGQLGEGDIFVTTATYANGPEILDRDGRRSRRRCLTRGPSASEPTRSSPLSRRGRGTGEGFVRDAGV